LRVAVATDFADCDDIVLAFLTRPEEVGPPVSGLVIEGCALSVRREEDGRREIAETDGFRVSVDPVAALVEAALDATETVRLALSG
jgi:hypothetical protein